MNGIKLAFLVFIMSALPAGAAGFEVLAPHRAVYEVKLLEAEDRAGIEAMDGRIVYEMTGNACEGISIQYRFVTRIRAGREIFVTDQQSASYESPDGKEFSFSTKSFVNDQPDQEIKGSASSTVDGIRVVHSGKENRVLDLQSGLFTTSHLLKVMESAQNGEAFVSHSVFDGSGDADKVLNSASVIGKQKIVPEKIEGESGKGLEALLETPAWPVTMSYFENGAGNTAESLPIYEASFLLYGNGVTRDLTMRYPEYELKATLTEIEFLDVESCG